MAGYIGAKQGVTQVDGYNRSEADAEFVQTAGDTMTGALVVDTAYQNGLRILRDYNVQSGPAAQAIQIGAKLGSTPVYPIEMLGVVDTDGTAFSFEIRQDTNLHLNIDAAGRVTMPYQPMFSAFNLATGSQYPSTYSTWATFDSNLTNFDSPRYAAETNIGSHYSTSNGRFTAPVAGRYLISLSVSMWVGNTSYITFFKNGAYSSPYQLVYNADLGGYQNMTLVRVMTLAASDYVEPGFYASSGTYATFIPGGGYIQFSGHLVG